MATTSPIGANGIQRSCGDSVYDSDRCVRRRRGPMPANLKTVVRLDFPYDPVMGARFAREADIELRTCKREGADDNAWIALAEAHVYLVSSAKDELPRHWSATPPPAPVMTLSTSRPAPGQASSWSIRLA